MAVASMQIAYLDLADYIMHNYKKEIDKMINAKSWKELKRQLRPLQGKAVFELERHNSMNDGTFLRVLHQVKPRELVFYDGKQKVYLSVTEETEQEMNFYASKYTLVQIMEG